MRGLILKDEVVILRAGEAVANSKSDTSNITYPGLKMSLLYDLTTRCQHDVSFSRRLLGDKPVLETLLSFFLLCLQPESTDLSLTHIPPKDTGLIFP